MSELVRKSNILEYVQDLKRRSELYSDALKRITDLPLEIGEMTMNKFGDLTLTISPIPLKQKKESQKKKL